MNKWRETAGKTKDGFRRAGDYGKRHKFRLGVWLLILVHGVGAITSIRAIMDTRTSQGAVAWAISLNTMPIIAVPAYWVFGRDRFHGYLAAQGEDIKMLEGASRDALNALELEEFLVMPERQTPFVAEKLARSPFTRYNDVELCIDGEDSFRSMFDGIKAAKEYVLLQFYIVKHDNTGQELKKLLLEKVKEGVPIYFLYDKMGSIRLSQEYVRELQEGGVKMVAFSSTQGKGNRFQLNFRNHRKLLVVDGRVGWVGGINIGDEYIHGTEELGAWRDTMVKVEGPVVQCSQLSFLEDWYWAEGEALELQWTAQRAESGSDVRMLSLPSGPADALETCTLFYLAVINFAKERLWIATPYFVPDEQFVSALQLAALRGVDVRVIVPAKSDNFLVQLSGWSYVESLSKVGVKFYHYDAGFMHQKVVLVDDRYATVGTVNFDNRSFRLNFELTLAIEEEKFAKEVEVMLEKDLERSHEVKLEEFLDEPFYFKLAVKIARLMAPVQ